MNASNIYSFLSSGRKSANPVPGGTPTLKREGSVTDVNEDGSSNSSGTQKEPKPVKSGTDSGGSNTPTTDPNHWSKDEKYDAENMLDVNYKKHLTRHANKWVVISIIFRIGVY